MDAENFGGANAANSLAAPFIFTRDKIIRVIGPELEKLRKLYYSRFENDP